MSSRENVLLSRFNTRASKLVERDTQRRSGAHSSATNRAKRSDEKRAVLQRRSKHDGHAYPWS